MNKEPKSLALCLNNAVRDVRDFKMEPVSTITRQKQMINDTKRIYNSARSII